jgi:hypothetical protein
MSTLAFNVVLAVIVLIRRHHIDRRLPFDARANLRPPLADRDGTLAYLVRAVASTSIRRPPTLHHVEQ